MPLIDFITKKPKAVKHEKIDSNAGTGLKFENEIRDVCAVYQFLKVAYIQKFEVPVRFIPKHKNMKTGKEEGGFAMKTAKTGFDFVGGLITPEKNAIFIECKSTATGSIPLWQEDTGIKRHQIETMQWLENTGFVCLFLWLIRNGGTVYKFTPRQLAAGVGGSRKLTIADCEELRFPKVIKVHHGARDYFDFLGVLP